MKKLAVWILLPLLLTGCSGRRDELDRVMALRADLLTCEQCTFDAAVTADYGDSLQTFAMKLEGDNRGQMEFLVTRPESISGITGRFASETGELTFEDVALTFPLLADDQVPPVSGPWIFYKTLLGGYLTSCGTEGEFLHVTIDDSYEEDALQLDIWLTEEDIPIRAEITYDNRRIVTVDIENFQFS